MSSSAQKLKSNLEQQLERLFNQLRDLDELGDELEEDEVATMREETLDQMKEFELSLANISDVSLETDVERYRQAIRAAISNAFKTPEVIKMFAQRQPSQLREKLIALERDHKLGIIKGPVYDESRLEVLSALEKLGETLSKPEKEFLASAGQGIGFQVVKEGASESYLKDARSQIKEASAK